MENEYRDMREKFLNGYITEDEWRSYCTSILYSMMEQKPIIDVIQRLSTT